MGGAATLAFLLSMIRVKFAAVLLGSSGIGLLTSFTSLQTVMGAIFGLGLQSSAVREIALAVSRSDEHALSRSAQALRRICLLAGSVGALVTVAFSSFISQMTFGSDQYILEIACLGLIILMITLSGGELALLQGMRRIGDQARTQVFCAIVTTIVAVGLYGWMGSRGIMPTLVSVAAVQLTLSWYYARRLRITKIYLSWKETFSEAEGLIRAGLVFMWCSLVGAAVNYITIILIAQKINIAAVGIYSAAFALSGIFLNFFLGAMGADYYPLLTSVAKNKVAMNQLVNEQTEIGLLITTPGLMATMALAPWIIQIFYTAEFLPATDLLQWFVLGCLGKVISWPLGFVMLALGKSRIFFFTETIFGLLHLVLISAGLYLVGIRGVAIAYFFMLVVYLVAVRLIAQRLTGFHWSSAAKRLIWISVSALGIIFALINICSPVQASIIGTILSILVGLYCLRGLIQRIGVNARLAQIVEKYPGFRRILTKVRWLFNG
jgi:antigen flippase